MRMDMIRPLLHLWILLDLEKGTEDEVHDIRDKFYILGPLDVSF